MALREAYTCDFCRRDVEVPASHTSGCIVHFDKKELKFTLHFSAINTGAINAKDFCRKCKVTTHLAAARALVTYFERE